MWITDTKRRNQHRVFYCTHKKKKTSKKTSKASQHSCGKHKVFIGSDKLVEDLLAVWYHTEHICSRLLKTSQHVGNTYSPPQIFGQHLQRTRNARQICFSLHSKKKKKIHVYQKCAAGTSLALEIFPSFIDKRITLSQWLTPFNAAVFYIGKINTTANSSWQTVRTSQDW